MDGEAGLQCEVEKMLRARESALIWHHCGGRAQHCRGVRGIPDLFILGTSGLWAELKYGSAHPAGDQVTWKYRLSLAGQAYVVWNDRDFYDGSIERTLDKLMLPGPQPTSDDPDAMLRAFDIAMSAPEPTPTRRGRKRRH